MTSKEITERINLSRLNKFDDPSGLVHDQNLHLMLIWEIALQLAIANEQRAPLSAETIIDNPELTDFYDAVSAFLLNLESGVQYPGLSRVRNAMAKIGRNSLVHRS
jgi:hypothetical protein